MTETPATPRELEAVNVDELINEIVHVRETKTQNAIRAQEKRPYMYLSDVHTCVRHNYYSMVEGDKRRPITPWLQELFGSGNIWEDETVRELMAMRFQVIAGQQSIKVKYGGHLKDQKGVVIGSGKIDGKIKYKGFEFPTEIKSVDGNVFRSINDVEDLFGNEFTEKYVRQLLLYLWGDGLEQGLFLINDRSNHWKLLPIYLGNYIEYVEQTLKKMEAAWEAKIGEKEPERITYNHKICGNCQFNGLCCPETVLEGGVVLNDPDLEKKIERHEELKGAKKEYDAIHSDLRPLFEGKPQVTVGNFIVIPKSVNKKGSITMKALPKDVLKNLEQYRGKPKVEWRIEIQDIRNKPEADAA